MTTTVDVRAPAGEAVWFAGVKERGYLNRAGVQARVRGYFARKDLSFKAEMATRIQSTARGRQRRLRYPQLLAQRFYDAATRIQALWRGQRARRRVIAGILFIEDFTGPDAADDFIRSLMPGAQAAEGWERKARGR